MRKRTINVKEERKGGDSGKGSKEKILLDVSIDKRVNIYQVHICGSS